MNTANPTVLQAIVAVSIRLFPRRLHHYWLSCFNVFCNLRWYFLPSQAAWLGLRMFYILCRRAWQSDRVTWWYSPGVSSSCVDSSDAVLVILQTLSPITSHTDHGGADCSLKFNWYELDSELNFDVCVTWWSSLLLLVWSQSDLNWGPGGWCERSRHDGVTLLLSSSTPAWVQCGL